MPAIKKIGIERIPNVTAAVQELRDKEATVYPVNSTYASKLGHPCLRFLAYHRTAWDVMPKPSAKLSGIFRRGRVMGDDIANEVKAAMKAKGLAVVENEVSIPPNEYGIGGRIDFGIMVAPADGERPLMVPVEAKSMNEFTWADIPPGDSEALAWMLNHRSAYMRCYPVQILLYMHFKGIDKGLIYARNASSYEDRQINVHYDPNMVDDALDKAAQLKDLVEELAPLRKPEMPAAEFLANVDPILPTRVPYDPDICGKCDFCPWCLPDITRAAGIIDRLSDADLDAKCRVILETADVKSDYEAANEAVGKHVKAIMADKKEGGPAVTILTQNFAIVARKGKTVTKKIITLAELGKGGAE